MKSDGDRKHEGLEKKKLHFGTFTNFTMHYLKPIRLYSYLLNIVAKFM